MVSPGDLDDDRLTAAGPGTGEGAARPEAPSDGGTDRCIRGRPSRWAAGLELDLHVPSRAGAWELLFDSTVPVTAAIGTA
jgi:hypothetical protein